MTMEVDHVVPESLLGKPGLLAQSLESLGLPPSFDLNSFANWLPVCRPCQLNKLQIVFEPTPLIQLQLQKLRSKAEQAEKAAQKSVKDKSVSKAWALIQMAASNGELRPSIEQEILTFATQLMEPRQPEMEHSPLKMTPLFQIISEGSGLRLIRGPYGVGASPINPTGSYICGTCGCSAWNGARCVICGNMDED